jgi:hypothetical protein
VLHRLADAPGPYGVFGYFDSLTLATDKSLHGKKVLAQNLAGDKTIDISSLVQVRGKCLFIPHQHGAGEEWQPPAEGEELLVGEPA